MSSNNNNSSNGGGGSNSNDNPQAGQGRPLPKKEADLFKALVKQYESKQYKKAIKAADTILKKYPNHGETLVMKGLTVYYSSPDRKEEAHNCVKLGLRNDMRSHVCWHVYGLLHRADRNYLEAIKAYKQALRIDQENLQILRDLSLLQIQMRDLSGFAVTRNAILNLKPTAQTNWLSFALSKHLQGQYDGALQVIDIYLGTLTEDSPEVSRSYQPSELQMYKSYLLLRNNDPLAALNHLEQCRDIVMDRGAWLWHKSNCHFALAQYEETRATLLQILQRGATEDYRVHAAYQCAVLQLTTDEKFTGMDTLATTRVLTQEQKSILLQQYETDLKQQFPRSAAIQRIPLTLVEGDALKSKLNVYVRKHLMKGVPSLALDLGSLALQEHDGRYTRVSDPVDFQNHATMSMLREMTDEFIRHLQEHSKFHPDDTDEQEPSTIFWALFLQAGLYELAGDYTKSLDLLTQCLEHTPTAVDVYEVQARVLQKSGDLESAVDAIDKGRDLDQQDRYMNNLTTKFMLQANMPAKALERIGLFTNNDAKTSPDDTLFEMQCSWYELELADCLVRQGNYGRALKKYAAVMKHFEDIHEDQFDFHSYCIRKVTLRAYCDVLDWEDNLWGQPYYRRAAEGTINLYRKIYDDPTILADVREPDYSEMSAAEKKKAKAVARKKKKAAEKKATNGDEEEVEGKDLLLKDPLEECSKLSAILSKHAPNEVSTWLLQYDVAIRRGKVLMAMQALFKGRALDPTSSDLLTRIVDFGLKSAQFTTTAEYPAVVRDVIDSELPTLLNNHASVADFVGAVVATNSNASLPYRIATARALVLVQKASAEDAAKYVTDAGLDGHGVSVESCREALEAFKALGAREAITEWIVAVKERFPLIKDFE